jgi:hemin uptake protein HemP
VYRGRRRSAAGERDALEDQPPAPRIEVRRISSLVLLGEQGELIIEHDGRDYRLRLTQNGKLILTA